MTYQKKLIDDYFSTWFNLTKDTIELRIEYEEALKIKAEYNRKLIEKMCIESGLKKCSCGEWLKKITGSHLKSKKHLGN